MRRNGLKKHLVTLLRRSTGIAPNGEAIDTFTPSGAYWAEISPRTVREVDAAGRFVTEEDTFNIVFGYDQDIASMTGGDRISYNGRTYEPTGSPLNADGMDRELTIQARIVTPSTA